MISVQRALIFRDELLALVLHFVAVGRAARGLQHHKSKEVNLFPIYNIGFCNAMYFGSHVDLNESSLSLK